MITIAHPKSAPYCEIFLSFSSQSKPVTA